MPVELGALSGERKNYSENYVYRKISSDNYVWVFPTSSIKKMKFRSTNYVEKTGKTLHDIDLRGTSSVSLHWQRKLKQK